MRRVASDLEEEEEDRISWGRGVVVVVVVIGERLQRKGWGGGGGGGVEVLMGVERGNMGVERWVGTWTRAGGGVR